MKNTIRTEVGTEVSMVQDIPSMVVMLDTTRDTRVVDPQSIPIGLIDIKDKKKRRRNINESSFSLLNGSLVHEIHLVEEKNLLKSSL